MQRSCRLGASQWVLRCHTDKGGSRTLVRGVVLTILLFIARKANPATARLGQIVMTGLMIEMVRSSSLQSMR